MEQGSLMAAQQWLLPFKKSSSPHLIYFSCMILFQCQTRFDKPEKTPPTEGFLSGQQIFAQVKRFHSSGCWEGRPALTKQGCQCWMGRRDGGTEGWKWGLTWKHLSNQDWVYSGYSIRCNLCSTSSTQWEAETVVLWLLAAVGGRRSAAGSQVHRGGGFGGRWWWRWGGWAGWKKKSIYMPSNWSFRELWKNESGTFLCVRSFASTGILRPVKNVFYWRLTRWMSDIWELKSARSSCHAFIYWLVNVTIISSCSFKYACTLTAKPFFFPKRKMSPPNVTW